MTTIMPLLLVGVLAVKLVLFAAVVGGAGLAARRALSWYAPLVSVRLGRRGSGGSRTPGPLP